MKFNPKLANKNVIGKPFELQTMQELQLSNINLAYHERALDFFFQSTALLIIY